MVPQEATRSSESDTNHPGKRRIRRRHLRKLPRRWKLQVSPEFWLYAVALVVTAIITLWLIRSSEAPVVEPDGYAPAPFVRAAFRV